MSRVLTIGMRCEARQRQDPWRDGQWRDSCAYAILEQEWRISSE